MQRYEVLAPFADSGNGAYGRTGEFLIPTNFLEGKTVFQIDNMKDSDRFPRPDTMQLPNEVISSLETAGIIFPMPQAVPTETTQNPLLG
jgi:hypothetical protein